MYMCACIALCLPLCTRIFHSWHKLLNVYKKERYYEITGRFLIISVITSIINSVAVVMNIHGSTKKTGRPMGYYAKIILSIIGCWKHQA